MLVGVLVQVHVVRHRPPVQAVTLVLRKDGSRGGRDRLGQGVHGRDAGQVVKELSAPVLGDVRHARLGWQWVWDRLWEKGC